MESRSTLPRLQRSVPQSCQSICSSPPRSARSWPRCFTEAGRLTNPATEKATPEAPVTLAGLRPDLDLEHAGARIDERLRLLLWRRLERPRGLPLWIAVALRQSGVRPLLAPTQPPAAVQDAVDRVLADLSFGLSQSRPVGEQPRVAWVELADAPAGAEDLLYDLPPASEPPLQPKGTAAPLRSEEHTSELQSH